MFSNDEKLDILKHLKSVYIPLSKISVDKYVAYPSDINFKSLYTKS